MTHVFAEKCKKASREHEAEVHLYNPHANLPAGRKARKVFFVDALRRSISGFYIISTKSFRQSGSHPLGKVNLPAFFYRPVNRVDYPEVLQSFFAVHRDLRLLVFEDHSSHLIHLDCLVGDVGVV